MKSLKDKILYIVLAILILIVVGLLTYETSDAVIFNNNIVNDLGKIDKDQEIKTEFKYVNTIYDEIRIYGVKDGCDCTESLTKVGTYYKGDTVKIFTKYFPQKYNDSGLVKKQIFLITNKNLSTADTLMPLILMAEVE